jgi:Na+/glutamate symporter
LQIVDWQFTVPATLAIAALVLVVGRRLIEHVAFLRKYSIPEPVVGGLVTALLITIMHAGGVRITFDTSLQPGLMLAFFATIGLGADARMLARGGIALLLFTACVVAMLVMQNVIGVGAAWAMGIDPLIGLISGSVTMSGGHGTGAAWGQKFAETFGLAAAPGIRNGLALAKWHEIDGEALSFAGTVSLSLFLAMALMSLRLWELAALALPMFAILALQAIGVGAIHHLHHLSRHGFEL